MAETMFSRALRATRLAAHKTLRDVSESTGLSVSYLSDCEHGRRGPLTIEQAVAVSKACGADEHTLMMNAVIAGAKFTLSGYGERKSVALALIHATAWHLSGDDVTTLMRLARRMAERQERRG